MPKKRETAAPPTQITLRVVFLFEREANAWIAQCLEYDIAAQGKSLHDVEQAFERTVVGQIMLDIRKGRDPFEGIRPAPRFYWHKFNEGYRLGVEPTIDLPRSTPPAFLIEQIRQESRVAG
jgi:hypothetical protein